MIIVTILGPGIVVASACQILQNEFVDLIGITLKLKNFGENTNLVSFLIQAHGTSRHLLTLSFISLFEFSVCTYTC